MTDFERADALDDLSSDELEAQAFGPDPDARRSLRGLAGRPAAGAVSIRVKDKSRRWPKVLLGAAAGLAVLIAGVAIGVDMERGATPEAEVMQRMPDVLEMEGDLIEAELDAMGDAFDAEADAMEEAFDAETDAMEEAIDADADVIGGPIEEMEGDAEPIG